MQTTTNATNKSGPTQKAYGFELGVRICFNNINTTTVFWDGGYIRPAYCARRNLLAGSHLSERDLEFDRKQLLLLSGDIERNPGPKCNKCGGTIRISEKHPLMCNTCNQMYHKQKKCSELSKLDLDDIADNGGEWTCNGCRREGDEDIPSQEEIPIQPPTQQARRDADAREMCGHCDKLLRKSTIPLVCQQQGCSLKCHINKACSGISRYSNSKKWICHLHGGRPKQAVMNQPGNPTTQKCCDCGHTIRSDTVPLSCSKCQKKCHQQLKCSGITRDGAEAIIKDGGEYTCKKCSTAGCREYDSVHPQGEEVSEANDAGMQQGLNILQWNADGINTKTTELRDRLVAENIDICMIQESKLQPHMKTPTLSGFKPIYRVDRKGTVKGGGLITYAKDTIMFEKLRDSTNKGTDSSSIRVKMGKRSWATITNVYTPPVNSVGQEIKFDPEKITANEESIILGDFNGHSPLWDVTTNPDTRGGEIEDWIITNNLTVLNDGSATRMDRVTFTESTPDITLVGDKWKNKCTWQVGEQIGLSDHLPIKTVVNVKVTHQPVFGKEGRWKRNGVDWSVFKEEVEKSCVSLAEEKNLTRRVQRFNDILTDAAKKHVGKTKPGKKNNSFITPTVRAALKKRNQFRQKISTHRKEWLEACKEAQEEINNSKEESWKDLLESAIEEVDDSRMWKIIKSLNGSPATNSPNEAMSHNGKTITSNKRKADIFSQHYAAVSKLKFSKEDRKLNREAKKKINAPSVDNKYTQPFTREELKKAIRCMKRKGAQGPDEIPPTFLKELGPRALDELLEIFNQSLSTASCPQVWRNAIIIPLLKAGKSAKDLASYRPISLTSCVVKLLERMIATRLYHLAETQGMFSPLQAGFRKGRGCDDQISRIIQAIENGFQAKPMKRSVLVLLDFSKAYDTVWRERLLLSMINKGVPMMFIRWLHAFLQNRQAKVKFCGTNSNSRVMRQGLPQGSVLSPILFLFYIDNLADILPESVVIAMFADDVTILSTDKDREEATRKAQVATDIVAAWAKEWKLSLNTDKSEVSFFSTWAKEAKWEPTIVVNGDTIKFKPTPRLLGVILDRQLNFGPQVETLREKLSPKYRMLSAISNTKWGWRKEDLMKVYLAHFNSVINYAGFAWQPSTAESHIESLERLQNRALRIVTGQYQSSPTEALRREVGMPSIQTQVKRNAVKAAEKSLRLPDDHPRAIAFNTSVANPRNKRQSWRSLTEDIKGQLPAGMENRCTISYFDHEPWLSAPNLEVFPLLYNIKRTDPEEEKKSAALQRIREVDASTTIYTDGSADAGIFEGGSAVVVTHGDPASPTVTTSIQRKGAPFTCSYEEEVDAMIAATAWIRDNIKDGSSTMICTDSQSLCQALESFNLETEAIRRNAADCSGAIVLQWIPGHSAIPGNDLADAEAKAATELGTVKREVSFRSACTMVKRTYKDVSSHPRTAKVYRHFSKEKEKTEIDNRADQVTVAQLRTGHHKSLKAYAHRLDDSVDPTCEECREEPHTLEHWFERCSSTSAFRQQLFGGETEKDIGLLTKCPKESVALARKSLRD